MPISDDVLSWERAESEWVWKYLKTATILQNAAHAFQKCQRFMKWLKRSNERYSTPYSTCRYWSFDPVNVMASLYKFLMILGSTIGKRIFYSLHVHAFTVYNNETKSVIVNYSVLSNIHAKHPYTCIAVNALTKVNHTAIIYL